VPIFNGEEAWNRWNDAPLAVASLVRPAERVIVPAIEHAFVAKALTGFVWKKPCLSIGWIGASYAPGSVLP